MKVGWTSNNHAGGWVRIALAPYGQHKTHKAFDDNVMKITCYGHDQRPGKHHENIKNLSFFPKYGSLQLIHT